MSENNGVEGGGELGNKVELSDSGVEGDEELGDIESLANDNGVECDGRNGGRLPVSDVEIYDNARSIPKRTVIIIRHPALAASQASRRRSRMVAKKIRNSAMRRLREQKVIDVGTIQETRQVNHVSQGGLISTTTKTPNS